MTKEFTENIEINDSNMLSKIKKAFKKEAHEFTAEYAWSLKRFRYYMNSNLRNP